MNDQRVIYETAIPPGQKARVRWLEALIQCRGSFDANRTMRFGRKGDRVVHIRLSPDEVVRFHELSGRHARYVSPYRLISGSMVPVYESPNDELAARACGKGASNK